MTATHSDERPDKAAPFHLHTTAAYDAGSALGISPRSRQQQGEYVEAHWRPFESPIKESGASLDIPELAGINEEFPPPTHIEFAHPCEEEFAGLLDARNVEWLYKPRTFAVEWDEDGNFVDCFTPDFYLVADETYIALIAPERSECNAKTRNVRLLRQQHPEIRIEIIANP